MRRERLVLVHGTGATAASHVGTAWWQDGGVLWQRVQQLGAGAMEVEAFIWSGANDEGERRAAGRRLAAHIAQHAAAGESFHLVGHSHGGSVIWHALQQLDAVQPAALARVRSWASIGTPFLHYGVRSFRLILGALAVLLSGAAVAAAVWSLRGVELSYAWRDEALITALWAAAFAVPASLLVWGALAATPAFRAALAPPPGSERLTSGPQARRYLGLWSEQDEPILGLGASTSFQLKVLPEATRNVANPLQRLLHPIAAATNQLVNNLVSRRVQGSSLLHLELRATTPYPHALLAQHPLPPEVDGPLVAEADTHSADLGRRVRSLLRSGRDPVSGFNDLQSAAAQAVTLKELVHTTYFQQQPCIDLLLWHIREHSALGLPDPIRSRLPLAERYTNRSLPTPAPLPSERRLPSNRMGYFIAAATTILAIVIGSAASSLATMHRVAFAPTTPEFHLQAGITSEVLATALATTRRRDAETDPRLKDFARVIQETDATAQLVRAAGQLENPQLKRLYALLVIELSRNGAQRQLQALAQDARSIAQLVLPVFSQHEDLTEGDPGYLPLAGYLAEGLARSGEIADADVAALTGACAAEPICKDRVRLEFILAALRHKRQVPPSALPLPPARVKYALSEARTKEGPLWVPEAYDFVKATPSSMLLWFVQQQAWDYLPELINPGSEPLNWEQFAAVIDATLSAGKPSLQGLSALLVGASWSRPPAAATVAKLLAAVEAAPADAPTARWKGRTSAALRQLLAQAQCAERAGAADSCGTAPVKRTQEVKAPPPRIEDVLGEVAAEVCSPKPEQRLSDRLEGWRQQIAGKLAALGPAPTRLPEEVLTWVRRMEEATRAGPENPFCAQGEDAVGAGGWVEGMRAFNLALATWLTPQHVELARTLLLTLPRSITLTPKDAQGPRMVVMPHWAEKVAAWGVANGEHLMALHMSETLEPGALLLRRAALFRVAACLHVRGFSEEAARLARLGEQTDEASRFFGVESFASGYLVHARVGEALYAASRRDWRKAGGACEGCDADGRLAFTTSMLPVFRSGQIGARDRASCEKLDGEDVQHFVRMTEARQREESGRRGMN